MPELTEKVLDRLFDKMDSIDTKIDTRFERMESEFRGHLAIDADRTQYNRMKLEEIERQTKATNGKVAEHEARRDGHDRVVWQIRGMWALVIILSMLMTFGDKFSKLFGG